MSTHGLTRYLTGCGWRECGRWTSGEVCMEREDKQLCRCWAVKILDDVRSRYNSLCWLAGWQYCPSGGRRVMQPHEPLVMASQGPYFRHWSHDQRCRFSHLHWKLPLFTEQTGDRKNKQCIMWAVLAADVTQSFIVIRKLLFGGLSDGFAPVPIVTLMPDTWMELFRPMGKAVLFRMVFRWFKAAASEKFSSTEIRYLWRTGGAA